MLEGQAAKIHEELWNNWSMLQFALDSYSELFRERETREILDPFGGEILALWIWPTLWNDLILRLTRLTDPAATGAKSNISLARLLEFCGDDDELRADIVRALEKARRATSPARDVRNKVIAHADEKQSLVGSKMGPQSLDEVAGATAAIYEVLEKFDLRRLDRHVMSEVVHHMPAHRLIVQLESASHAVRYIAEFLTDPGEPGRFNHEAARSFLACLGREYDPQVDLARLMHIWELGRHLPPPRPVGQGED